MDDHTIALRVAARHQQDDRAIALRVAAQYQKTVLGAHWEGKIVGKDFRLQWSRDQYLLEELPQKGKKKLRVATMNGGGNIYSGTSANMSAYIPQNILRQAHVSSSDTYDHVKQKLQAAMDAAAEEVISKNSERDWAFLRHTKWNEHEVNYLQVMPEGMEAIVVEGADFSVKAEWTSFKSYSPNSDFQQADPHYTLYEASSPGAARKFYQMARENPGLIKHIGWNKFSDWLNQNKIGYKTHFSQWH
jgi:hypothetical protein